MVRRQASERVSSSHMSIAASIRCRLITSCAVGVVTVERDGGRSMVAMVHAVVRYGGHGTLYGGHGTLWWP